VKQKKKSSVEMQALKALVTVYGPREAARVSGIPYGTISAMAFKFQWKKAGFRPRVSDGSDSPIAGKDAGDLLKESLEKSKSASTMHLAKFTERASEKAATHKDPLEVARAVKDVASVYNVLWPAEEESQLIEGAILLGHEKPTINVAEIEEAKVMDVRADVQDAGQAGH
jgi:hypothetical protein